MLWGEGSLVTSLFVANFGRLALIVIASMKIWRIVLIVIHSDHDAVKAADLWHVTTVSAQRLRMIIRIPRTEFALPRSDQQLSIGADKLNLRFAQCLGQSYSRRQLDGIVTP